MSLTEYLSFALFFGFLILWNILAYQGTIAPERLLRTRWGKHIRRNTSAKQFQRICTLFLVAGIFFLGFSLFQLSNGTFRLKGNPKPYGFSDFLK
jgi:hypothetical protein